MGNGSSLPVISVVDLVLLGPFHLKNVLVAPNIIQDLLFVHCFTTNNSCFMEYDLFGLSVKNLATRTLITRCDISGHCTLFGSPHPPPPRPPCMPWLPPFCPSVGIIVSDISGSMSYPSCLAALSSLVAHRPHKSCAMEEEYEALMANHMYDLCCVSLAPTWSSTSGSSVTSSRLMIL